MKGLLVLVVCFVAGAVSAQGTGLIHLMPPIQLPASAASRPAAAASGVKAVNANPKALLNGSVALSLIVDEPGQQRIRVQFAKPYARAEHAQVLAAGRAVQRDVKAACRNVCKPGPMTAPTLAEDGKLSFDLVLQGLDRGLSQTDMLLVLEGKPLPKTPAPKPQPAASAPEAKP